MIPFEKVSVLVPTRGRPERLRTLLSSYDATVLELEHRSELVFRVDDDDEPTRDLLLANCEHRVIVGPRRQGYGSLPEFFNEMLRYADGDVLMCGNDDMVFRTVHWAMFVLSAAGRYPDGLFDFGVSTLNESHFPFSIVSKKAVDRMGFIWDPNVFWGDIFLRDVMASFGRCFMLPGVRIDHDWVGHHPDQVFIESDKDIIRRDPTYWSGTHAKAVAGAVDKLKGLLA